MNAPSTGHPLASVDASSFDEFIRHGVVLMDFSEPWCGPCHLQLPILERVAERVRNRATVALLNVDEAPAVAVRFNIEAIPTLVLFKEGRVARTFVGVHPETTLTNAVLSVTTRPVPRLPRLP